MQTKEHWLQKYVKPHLKWTCQSPWTCEQLTTCMSISGCKLVANSKAHKYRTDWNQNTKLLIESMCKQAEIYWVVNIWRETQKQRHREGRRRLAKCEHHACSIMAKSAHTHKDSGCQDYSHLSPLSFTQLNCKVHPIPHIDRLPENRSRVKADVNGLNCGSRRHVAECHRPRVVFWFEQKPVVQKWKLSSSRK